MKYFWAVVLCVVLLYGYKYFEAVRTTVAASAVAAVEAQVQKSAEEGEQATVVATQATLAKRPARKTAVKSKQESDREIAKAAEQADPVYAAWADARVPDAVIDELWANARPEIDIRGRPVNGQLGPVVRPGGAATAPETGDRSAVERIRDFVTGRN